MFWSKKNALLLSICVCAVILAVAVFAENAFVKRRLFTHDSILNEVGIRLPKENQIIGVEANLFSFADGANYGWLIESQKMLIPWVHANMFPQDGWENIKNFEEVVPFSNKKIENLKIESVWKNNGKFEEFYFYLAEGRRIGYLQTFRP